MKGVTQEADVIVANILADILIHLTEDAYRLVKDEGYLIMSGIISEKWDMVRELAGESWFPPGNSHGSGRVECLCLQEDG